MLETQISSIRYQVQRHWKVICLLHRYGSVKSIWVYGGRRFRNDVGNPTAGVKRWRPTSLNLSGCWSRPEIHRVAALFVIIKTIILSPSFNTLVISCWLHRPAWLIVDILNICRGCISRTPNLLNQPWRLFLLNISSAFEDKPVSLSRPRDHEKMPSEATSKPIPPPTS